MNLHELSRCAGREQAKKRVGRGGGSGTGKTCGKGHKGQMSRKGHKRKPGFEGGQMRLVRRLPKRGFTVADRTRAVPVNVGALDRFDEGTEVTPEVLAKCGLVNGTGVQVKILAEGVLDRKLHVKGCACSAAAKAKIEAAGGTCDTGTS